jgi:hypothetical protein
VLKQPPIAEKELLFEEDEDPEPEPDDIQKRRQDAAKRRIEERKRYWDPED